MTAILLDEFRVLDKPQFGMHNVCIQEDNRN